MRLDSGNQTYINMMYQQIRPDFLDGSMLVIANKTLAKSLKVVLETVFLENCTVVIVYQYFGMNLLIKIYIWV